MALSSHIILTAAIVDDGSWKLSPDTVVIKRLKNGTPKEIGRGAFGTVYLGEYQSKPVAVKQLHASILKIPNALDVFCRELMLGHSLRHGNICEMYGGWNVCDDEEGIFPSIVMEYLPHTLRHVLTDRVKFQVTTRLLISIVQQLSSVLSFMHAQRPPLYHCDLKPENIMMTEKCVPKLVDFGCAKERRATIGRVSTLISGVRGTSGYIVCVCVCVCVYVCVCVCVCVFVCVFIHI